MDNNLVYRASSFSLANLISMYVFQQIPETKDELTKTPKKHPWNMMWAMDESTFETPMLLICRFGFKKHSQYICCDFHSHVGHWKQQITSTTKKKTSSCSHPFKGVFLHLIHQWMSTPLFCLIASPLGNDVSCCRMSVTSGTDTDAFLSPSFLSVIIQRPYFRL